MCGRWGPIEVGEWTWIAFRLKCLNFQPLLTFAHVKDVKGVSKTWLATPGHSIDSHKPPRGRFLLRGVFVASNVRILLEVVGSATLDTTSSQGPHCRFLIDLSLITHSETYMWSSHKIICLSPISKLVAIKEVKFNRSLRQCPWYWGKPSHMAFTVELRFG